MRKWSILAAVLTFVRHQSARRFLSRAAMGPGAGRIGRQHHRRRSRGRPRELLYSRQYPSLGFPITAAVQHAAALPLWCASTPRPASRGNFTLPGSPPPPASPPIPGIRDALRRPGQHRLVAAPMRRRLDPPVAVCARRDRHLSGGGPGQRQYPLRRTGSLWRFQERDGGPHLDRHLPRHRAGRSHPPRSAAPRPERHGRRLDPSGKSGSERCIGEAGVQFAAGGVGVSAEPGRRIGQEVDQFFVGPFLLREERREAEGIGEAPAHLDEVIEGGFTPDGIVVMGGDGGGEFVGEVPILARKAPAAQWSISKRSRSVVSRSKPKSVETSSIREYSSG